MLYNWNECQIESFSNASIILRRDSSSEEKLLSTMIWNTQKWSELKNEIDKNVFTCNQHILMVLEMFREMGLTEKTARECLRLLIETKDIPKTYVDKLCKIWGKYRTMNNIQTDVAKSELLISTARDNLYELFHLQLKELLGLSEERDAVLAENYKHQIDVRDTLQMLQLKESSEIFNDCKKAPTNKDMINTINGRESRKDDIIVKIDESRWPGKTKCRNENSDNEFASNEEKEDDDSLGKYNEMLNDNCTEIQTLNSYINELESPVDSDSSISSASALYIKEYSKEKKRKKSKKKKTLVPSLL